jgi:polyketide synthase PksJ/polyketide synthase PksN
MLAKQEITKEEAEKLLSQVKKNAIHVNETATIEKASTTQDNEITDTVINQLRSIISDITHVEIEELKDDVSLRSIGIDSINGVEIVRDINTTFNIQADASIIYDYENLYSLAEYIREQSQVDLVPKHLKVEEKTISSMELIKSTDSIKSTESIDSTDDITESLITIVEDILHLSREDIEKESYLRDLGIDSINGVEIVREINEAYDINLDTVNLYNHERICDLSNYISKEVHGQEVYNRRDNKIEKSNTKTASIKKAEENKLAEEKTISSSYKKQLDTMRKPRKMNLVTPSTKHHEKKVTLSNRKTEIKMEKNITQNNIKQDKIQENINENKLDGQDIAIIGISSYFPGAEDVHALWENLKNNKSTTSIVPSDRWSWEDYYDENSQEINKTYSKHGGFLTDVDIFDSLFFSISPTEAGYMDPQHRLFLQEAYKAVEDAGYHREALTGKKCGVYVGAAHGDYNNVLKDYGLDNNLYSFNGLNVFSLSGYISYNLNLTGPNMTIDTACSSSLVAVHQACQSIRSGESDMAIAGGIRLILKPDLHIRTSNLDMLSRKGVSRPLDKEADGIVLSEGVSVIVMKKLDQAIEERDHIYAIIKGSGVNHNGTSKSIAALDEVAQKNLVSSVYSTFGINPKDISYLEVNATGSREGDAGEISALTDVFKKYTDKKQYCPIGTLKSNIGHTTMASGVGGLIKIIMSLQNGEIPAMANFHDPNELIDWVNTPFYVNKENISWEKVQDKNRLAAISCFGAGGTNCHIVVEEATDYNNHSMSTAPYHLVVISAKKKESLQQKILDMRSWLINQGKNYSIEDISFTSLLGREQYSHRFMCIVKDYEDLLEQLSVIDINVLDTVKGYSVVNKSVKGNIHINTNIVEEGNRLLHTLVDSQSKETYYNILLRVSQMYLEGQSLQWQIIYNKSSAKRIPMPTYPFAKKHHWIEAQPKEKAPVQLLHPLIHRNNCKLNDYKYITTFSKYDFILEDHQIDNKKILPGMVYLEMASTAARLLTDNDTVMIRDCHFAKPCVVTDEKDVITSFYEEDDYLEYSIYSLEDGKKVIHSRGTIDCSINKEDLTSTHISVQDIINNCPKVIDGNKYYKTYEKRGLYLGESFNAIKKIYMNDNEVISKVQLPSIQENSYEDYDLHPSLLDSAVETIIGSIDGYKNDNGTYVPYDVEALIIMSKLPRNFYVYGIRINGLEDLIYDIYLVNDKGETIVLLQHVTFIKVENEKEKTIDKHNSNKVIDVLLQLQNSEIEVADAIQAMEGVLNG